MSVTASQHVCVAHLRLSLDATLCVQFMGDIVKPASKDAGGQIEGTVTDLKEQVRFLQSRTSDARMATLLFQYLAWAQCCAAVSKPLFLS